VAAVARALAPAAARAERALLLGGRWPWEGRLPAAEGGDWRAAAWRLHLSGAEVGLLVPAAAGRLPEGLPVARLDGLAAAAQTAIAALNLGEVDAVHVDLTTCPEDDGAALLRAAGLSPRDAGPAGQRWTGALRRERAPASL